MPFYKRILIFGLLLFIPLSIFVFKSSLLDNAKKNVVSEKNVLNSNTTVTQQESIKQCVDPDKPIRYDKELNTPNFIWLKSDKPHSSSINNQKPEVIALNCLKNLAPIYKLKEQDLDDMANLHNVHDIGWGPVIVQFKQAIDGIEVYGKRFNVAMTRQGNPSSVSGNFSPHKPVQIDDISAETAISHALEDLSQTQFPASAFELQNSKNAYRYYCINNNYSDKLAKPARLKPVFYDTSDRIQSAYYIELKLAPDSNSRSQYVAYIISAENGKVLHRKNLIAHLANHKETKSNQTYSYRVWADPEHPCFSGLPYLDPTGRLGHPYPANAQTKTYQPPYVDSTLISLASGPSKMQDPWLPAGAIETTGNNVDVFIDVDGNGDFSSDEGDFRAPLSGPQAFDWPYDLNLNSDENQTQQYAAITNLFYSVNYLHDLFYDLGFDEQSGNAQESNYGRGGEGHDPIIVYAQDHTSSDNAYMATPADGESPIMRIGYYHELFSVEEADIFFISPQLDSISAIDAKPAEEKREVTGELVFIEDLRSSDESFDEDQLESFAGKIVLFQGTEENSYYRLVQIDESDAKATFLALPSEENQFYLRHKSFHKPLIYLTQNDASLLKDKMKRSAVSLRLKTTAGIRRECALDFGTTAHEWTHYMTDRLAGLLYEYQGGSISEGYSDFIPVALSVHPDQRSLRGNDHYQGAYVFSAYVDNDWYNSIRQYPISVDMSLNPLTFNDIEKNPDRYKAGGVWTVVLWDAYINLLNDERHTFREAQRKMFAYIVAALKMTPSKATFLNCRDAILASVYCGGDSQDYSCFDRAFVKRGMGKDAIGPDWNSPKNRGVVESFDFGLEAKSQLQVTQIELAEYQGNHNGIITHGESVQLNVTVKNNGPFPLDSLQAYITSPGQIEPRKTTVDLPNLNVGEIADFKRIFKLSKDQTLGELKLSLLFKDPGNPKNLKQYPGARDLQKNYTLPVSFKMAPNLSYIDHVENHGLAGWTLYYPNSDGSEIHTKPKLPLLDSSKRIQSTHYWSCVPVEGNPSQHVWQSPGLGSGEETSLISPLLSISQNQDLILEFDHRYDFMKSWNENESMAGGLIEISIDGGNRWFDAGSFAQIGYNSQLYGVDNPLCVDNETRNAYGVRSLNYPGFIHETYAFGKRFSGCNLLFRFRMGVSWAKLSKWEIDNIQVAGVTQPPFAVIEPSTSTFDAKLAINLQPAPSLFTSEAGAAAQINVSLNTKPDAEITLDLQSENANEGKVTPSQVVFNRDNWNLPQAVTITGQNDSLVDGCQLYQVSAACSDVFAKIMPQSLILTNWDNESRLELKSDVPIHIVQYPSEKNNFQLQCINNSQEAICFKIGYENYHIQQLGENQSVASSQQYQTGFDHIDGFIAGPIHGQNGWSSSESNSDIPEVKPMHYNTEKHVLHFINKDDTENFSKINVKSPTLDDESQSTLTFAEVSIRTPLEGSILNFDAIDSNSGKIVAKFDFKPGKGFSVGTKNSEWGSVETSLLDYSPSSNWQKLRIEAASSSKHINYYIDNLLLLSTDAFAGETIDQISFSIDHYRNSFDYSLDQLSFGAGSPLIQPADWLEFNQLEGTICGGDQYPLNLSLSEGTPAGTYSITVTVSDIYRNQTKKIPIILTVLPNDPTSVVLTDPVLDSLVRQALDNQASVLSRRDLACLRSLDVSHSNIRSLKGLEYAVNLQRINLNDTPIDNLRALASLTSISSLIAINTPQLDLSLGSADYSLLKKFKSQSCEVTSALNYPFYEAKADPDNPEWKRSEWFGLFKDDDYPWLQTEDFGMIYMHSVDQETSWFWHEDLGWWYSGKHFFPYIYQATQARWLFYLGKTELGYNLYDCSADQYFTTPLKSL